jgi:hypothetical protein
LILVDSSGWIEYLAARPKADLFAPYIEGSEPLLSSVIQISEIYKVVRRSPWPMPSSSRRRRGTLRTS